MFAGKSTELLRRVKRYQISGKKCLTVKYQADVRYSATHISTHDQQMIAAESCFRLEELESSDAESSWINYDVIGIDEGQFFEDIVEFSEKAANMNKVIIISALNSDY